MRKETRRLIVIGAVLGLCAGGWLPLRAQGASTQYLIVTTEALAPGFADLAAFRSSPEGGSLTVRMTTVEEIHVARLETTPEARIRAAIAAERPRLMGALAALPGVDVHPSDANFVLVTVPQARELWGRLFEEHSVLVRNVSGDPLLPDCLRITVGSPEENDRLLSALGQLLA